MQGFLTTFTGVYVSTDMTLEAILPYRFSDSPMISHTIHQYRILEKLGEGGMGVVYKAEDTKLKRTVALKFLPHELTLDPDAKERFLHEAQAASALDHPNICNIHEIGEAEDGQLYIVMAYYSGETLEKMIKRAPLKADAAISIALQIAEGLAKAHGAGIVHRDIKPRNVIITEDGVAKIIDFGLAKLRGQSKITRSGSTLGTAAYMSPEQIRSEELDQRSDLFSFGTLLYEMVTGKLPFRGDHDAALSYSIVNEEPLPLDREHIDVPAGLETVVRHCLLKEREKRYQSAGDIVADLRRIQQGRPIRGRATGKVTVPAALVGIGLAAAVVMLLAYLVFFSHSATGSKKSIAVLPFKNLNENKTDEYISDGVAEDIRTHLSKIADLKVISQQSVLQYRNSSKNVKEIGRELDVAAVLEGSVQRVGNQVRIAAQLIDAESEGHIWAEIYDQEWSQVFVIQSVVAQKIVAALKAKLSQQEKEQISETPTSSVTAYDLYLKAREYYGRRRREDNESAIKLLKKSLELDPKYALAYAGLGFCYRMKTVFGEPRSWLDSSIAMSQRSISINPALAEGYNTLGTVYMGVDPERALGYFRQALEYTPNHWAATHNMGVLYNTLGDLCKSLEWSKKAIALNPLGLLGYLNIASIYSKIEDLAQEKRWCLKALDIAPDYIIAYQYLTDIHLKEGNVSLASEYAAKARALDSANIHNFSIAGILQLCAGKFQEARLDFEKIMAADSDAGSWNGANNSTYLGFVLKALGDTRTANTLFEHSHRIDQEDMEQSNAVWSAAYDLAALSAVQGRKEEVFTWLRKSVDTGFTDYLFLQIDPIFEPFRNESQFTQLVEGMKAKVSDIRRCIERIEGSGQ